MDSQLKELSKNQYELEALLVKNKSLQKEIYLDIFCKKYGVNVGDTIIWFDFNIEKVGVFDSVIYNLINDVYCIVVRAIRVSGLPSTKTYKIYPHSFPSIKKLK